MKTKLITSLVLALGVLVGFPSLAVADNSSKETSVVEWTEYELEGEREYDYTLSLPRESGLRTVQRAADWLIHIDEKVALYPASQLSDMNMKFETTDPDANHVALSFESIFGGQVDIQMSDLEDGRADISFLGSSYVSESEIVKIRTEVYSSDGRQLHSSNDVAFMFDNFNRHELVNIAPLDKSVEVLPSSSAITVDGEQVSIQAYTINGSNYFKLRDLAMLLDGSDKSFEVDWDGENNAILLTTGNSYTVAGGELDIDDVPSSAQALLSDAKVFVDGTKIQTIPYVVNGNNYFKLRSIAAALEIGVTWDGDTNTVGLDTSSSYVDDDPIMVASSEVFHVKVQYHKKDDYVPEFTLQLWDYENDEMISEVRASTENYQDGQYHLDFETPEYYEGETFALALVDADDRLSYISFKVYTSDNIMEYELSNNIHFKFSVGTESYVIGEEGLYREAHYIIGSEFAPFYGFAVVE